MQAISPIEQALTTSIVNLVIIVLIGTLLVTFGRSWWGGLLLKIKEFVANVLRGDIARVEKKIDDHIILCNEFPNSLINEKLRNMKDEVESNFNTLHEKVDANHAHVQQILNIIDSRGRRK